MTEPRDDVTDAMQRLRGAVRDQILPPPAALLRARAARARRVRRTGTAVLAASAVAALAIGAAQVVDLSAPPPVPPAETPHPTASPSPAASPLPPPLPAVQPSPRPAPLPPAGPPDDPVAEVDWYDATIALPPNERQPCPSGVVQFRPFPGESGEGNHPRVFHDGRVLDIMANGDHPPWAYGDVTGDGRMEVIFEARCFLSDNGTDYCCGHGGQLLVVARADNGTLTGLGWVGPSHAMIMDVWVSEGRVLMAGDPGVTNPEDHFPAALPGLVLSYRWDGQRFHDWEPAAEYPRLVPLDGQGPGAPVRPRAVATGLGCPDVELRFARDESGGLVATGDGATFVVPTGHLDPYLVDLDNTGQRLLVTVLACTDADGWTRRGLAVFERSGAGWQGISVLTDPPAGCECAATVLGLDPGRGGSLVIRWGVRADDGGWEDGFSTPYRWTGTVLEPDDSQG